MLPDSRPRYRITIKYHQNRDDQHIESLSVDDNADKEHGYAEDAKESQVTNGREEGDA